MTIEKKRNSLIYRKGKKTRVQPKNKVIFKGDDTLLINKDIVVNNIIDSDYVYSTNKDLLSDIISDKNIKVVSVKVKVKERPFEDHCGTIMIPNYSEWNHTEEYLSNGDNWYNFYDVSHIFNEGTENEFRNIGIQIMYGDYTLESMTWNYDPSLCIVDGIFEMRVDMVIPEVLNLGKQYKIPEGLDDYMFMMIEEVKTINLANDDAFTIQKIQENFSGTLNINTEQYGENDMLGYKTTQCSELEINGQIYKIENGVLKLADVCTVLPKISKGETAKMNYIDELDFSNMKFDLDITKIVNTYGSYNCFNIDTYSGGFKVINLSGWDWKHIYERHNEAVTTIMTGKTQFTSYEQANTSGTGLSGLIFQMSLAYFVKWDVDMTLILGDLTKEQFDYFCRLCHQDDNLETFKKEGSPRIIYNLID